MDTPEEYVEKILDTKKIHFYVVEKYFNAMCRLKTAKEESNLSEIEAINKSIIGIEEEQNKVFFEYRKLENEFEQKFKEKLKQLIKKCSELTQLEKALIRFEKLEYKAKKELEEVKQHTNKEGEKEAKFQLIYNEASFKSYNALWDLRLSNKKMIKLCEEIIKYRYAAERYTSFKEILEEE